MFNIGFKICEVFAPQEFIGSGEKLLKQDLIVDIGDVGRSKEITKLAHEIRTTSILISLFGKKNQNCDFKIGDSGSIVGAFYQFGRGVSYRISGIRFENPSYKRAYVENGMKMLPDDFGQASFEYVLSELHEIKLAQDQFDLVNFFSDITSKVETAMNFDETCRLRTAAFCKSLPTMILAAGADLSLFTYLLNNGLNLVSLNTLINEYKTMSTSFMVDDIKTIESVHYKFIGLSQLEIERLRIQRKFIFFQSHEMHWFDFEGPIHFGDSDFLSTLNSVFTPDSIELEIINLENFAESEEKVKTKSNPDSNDCDMSSIVENDIVSSELSFEEYMEWCNLQDVQYELDKLVADNMEEQKLKEERELLEYPPFDDDELDEWNGIDKPNF